MGSFRGLPEKGIFNEMLEVCVGGMKHVKSVQGYSYYRRLREAKFSHKYLQEAQCRDSLSFGTK